MRFAPKARTGSLHRTRPAVNGPARATTRGVRPSLRRRLVSLLLALGALMLSAVALPNPAAAIPGIPDCTTPPTPEVPGRGVVGFFEPTPDTLPEAADPFAPESTTTIHQQYGYAGLRWNTYDLGCGPDMARAPDAPVGTSIANWLMTIPKSAIAATGALLSAAYQPDFLGVFDPMISKVVDALQRSVFEQWIGLTVAALGFLLIWKSRQAALSSSTSAIGWALLVMTIATVVFRWPLAAGHAADQTVSSVMSTVTGALNEDVDGDNRSPGAQATSNLHTSLLYQAWLGGVFGDANTEAATTHGPAIFEAQALSWREAELLRTDPDRGRELIERKQEAFESTAAKVKAEDPDAYEYLVGRRSDARVGYALLSLLGTLCAIPFLLISALLILGALIIVRFGVMMFPIFATLAVFPTMRGLVVGLGNTLAAALINSVVFGLGTAVMVKGIGVIMSPTTGLPPWLVVALMLLLTLVMWYALKPFRRLTQMVGSRNHFAEGVEGPTTARHGLLRGGGKLVLSSMGSFLGNTAARKVTEENGPTPVKGTPARAEAHGFFAIGPASTGGRRQAEAMAGAAVAGAAGAGSGAASAPAEGTPGPTARAGTSSGPSRSADREGTERAVSARTTAESAAGSPPSRGSGSWSEQDSPSATYLPGSGSPAESRAWHPAAASADQVPGPVEPSDAGGDQVFVIYRPDAAEESTGHG